MEKKITILTFIIFYTIITPFITADQHAITQYFWAHYQHLKKNSEEAEFWFARFFEKQVPFSAYEGYIQFLFSTKKFPLIYSMKDFILSNLSSNPSVILILADVLTLYKEEVALNSTILQLQQKHPNNINLTLRAVTILLEQKDFETAIARIDALLNKTSRNQNVFLFHFMKAQIYLQLDRLEDAIFSTKKSTEFFPYFDKAWLVLGILYEQLGAISDAIMSYKQYASCAEKPSPLFVQRSPILETQRDKIKESMKDSQARENIKKQINSFIEEKKYGNAMQYIDALLEHEPTNKEIKKLKITTLVHQKQHQTANNILQIYIQNDIEHKEEWITLSQQLVGTNR